MTFPFLSATRGCMEDVSPRCEAILKTLKSNGLKITPQRMAIARVLARSRSHPSVEEIFEHLKADFPTMSLATVYRNVLLITNLGEAQEIGFPDGSNRYDGHNPYPHPHVVCIVCKTILDPNVSGLQDITEEIAEATGFTIVNHRLDFFGLCPECRKKQ